MGLGECLPGAQGDPPLTDWKGQVGAQKTGLGGFGLVGVGEEMTGGVVWFGGCW